MTDTKVATPKIGSTMSATNSIRWAISDSLTIAYRDLLALIRIPSSMVFAIIQPVMFVLLFRYVFGGAIHTSNGSYVNYLVPGILVQTTLFGAIQTAIGLSEDLQKGLIERFRALPMARMAVLAGRTIADLARNILVLVVITVVGFAVGFRPGGGVIAYLQASLLLLFFAYVVSWGFAYVGLKAPNSETAQAMTFPIIFPLTFASGIFAPVAGTIPWLKAFSINQPVGQAANAVRGLMLGLPHGQSTWIALAWSVGILAVLAPLSVRAYRRVI